MSYRIGALLAVAALVLSACSISQGDAHEQRSEIIQMCDYEVECALGLVCAAQPWRCGDLDELELDR